MERIETARLLLRPWRAEREPGYVLHPAYWGNGYSPEAAAACIRHGFEEIGLEKIWCGYFEGNEKSRRVVEKCGFLPCSSLEKDVLGERRVEHLYCIKR